jgi:c(7)-type cytochrome triheme protein
LRYLFDGSVESRFFIFEVLVGTILPVLVFLTPRLRNNIAGLFAGAVMVLIGFITNRLNVAITGMARTSGINYIPSWMELAVTASIVAMGLVVFRYGAKYLPVFSSEEEFSSEPVLPPLVQAGKSGHVLVSIFSIALIAIIITLGVGQAKNSNESAAPVIEGAVSLPAAALSMPAPILIAKNGDSPGQVTFNHESHVDASAPSCKTCHSALFSIRPVAGHAADSAKAAYHDSKRCGACHSGEKASNIDDGCEMCHAAK